MFIEILAWLTVLGLPIALFGLIVWGFYACYWKRRKTDNPSPLGEMKVEVPEVTHVVDSEWETDYETDEPVVDCRKLVDPGTRVWRIYRSVDRIHWAECDPALTERAACNYADYIKRSNPEEFVRCNDPNGVILFYE